MRSGALEEEHLQMQIRQRWSAGVSLVRIRFDVVAKDEENSVLRIGGGARAADGRERRKTLERGRMRKDWSWLFIRKDS